MNTKLLSHFQKNDQLTAGNPVYQDIISNLFIFLTQNDHVAQDITSSVFLPNTISSNQKGGVIIAKEACVVAGVEEITYLCKKHTKITPKIARSDGEYVKENTAILEVFGEVKEILGFERAILNILQRMSGIATEANKYVSAVKSLHLKNSPYIAATRKTPWMHLDKKAVAVGGGITHRLNLQDGILLKDNHLAVLQQEYHLKDEAEAMQYAIEHAMLTDSSLAVEVEAKKDAAVFAAVKAFQKRKLQNPLIILLDNFTSERARKVIQILRHSEALPKNLRKNKILRFTQDDNNVFFEASGGINLENVTEWARTGVDIISIGALTHSPKAADLSLDIFVASQ